MILPKLQDFEEAFRCICQNISNSLDSPQGSPNRRQQIADLLGDLDLELQKQCAILERTLAVVRVELRAAPTLAEQKVWDSRFGEGHRYYSTRRNGWVQLTAANSADKRVSRNDKLVKGEERRVSILQVALGVLHNCQDSCRGIAEGWDARVYKGQVLQWIKALVVFYETGLKNAAEEVHRNAQ